VNARTAVMALLIALALGAGGGAVAQDRKDAKAAPVGKVTGIVLDSATGKPVVGAAVRIRKLSSTSDRDGRFLFEPVEIGNWVATSDVEIREGGFLGLFAKRVRYWGFAMAESKESGGAPVRILLEKHTEIEGVCRRCHPDRRTGELPVQRCLHHSGRELPAKMASRVARYNLANKKAKEENKPFYPPIPLEEHRRQDGSVYYAYHCESCHSVHQPTAYKRYVIAPYVESSVLCEGCH